MFDLQQEEKHIFEWGQCLVALKREPAALDVFTATATCPSQPFGREGQRLKYSIDKLDFKHLHNDIDHDNDGVSVLNFPIEMRLLTGDYAHRDINNINVHLLAPGCSVSNDLQGIAT